MYECLTTCMYVYILTHTSLVPVKVRRVYQLAQIIVRDSC